MFYLKQFLKGLKVSPIRGGVFFFCSFLLVFFWGNRRYFETQLTQLSSLEIERSYFHALVSSKENIEKISRKLRILPGVYRVVVLPHKKLKIKAEGLLSSFKKDLKDELEKDLFDFEFVGLKIIFNTKIKKRSQNLIRDYFLRLVGKNKVTLGPIQQKTSPGDDKRKKFFSFMKKWKGEILFLLLIPLWVLSLYIFSGTLTKQSYLIEQYQRRAFVRLKILCVGTFCIFSFHFLFMSLFGKIIELNFLYITLLFSLVVIVAQMRRRTWN